MNFYNRENINSKKEDEEKQDMYLTILGKQEYKTNEGFPCVSKDAKTVYAKRENNRTYILKNSEGLFDPMDPYGNNDPNKTRNGINIWNFKEVKENTFYYYCRYLSTVNKSWLLRAQREI